MRRILDLTLVLVMWAALMAWALVLRLRRLAARGVGTP